MAGKWSIRLRVVLRPWLREAARRDVERESGVYSRWRRALQWWPDGRTELVLIVALVLVAFVVAAKVWPACLIPNALDDDGTSGSLLGALWQVEAAAIAFSAAVMVFAVQTYLSSRLAMFGLAASDWARETRLERTVIVGFAAIFVTGLALVAFPHGDERPRAAMAALVIATLAVAWSAVMLGQAVRRIDPKSIYARRLRRVERCLADEAALFRVREVAERRLANVARKFDATVDDSAALAHLGQPVKLDARAGRIADVNLRRLVRVVRPARDGSLGAIARSLALGEGTIRGTALAAAPLGRRRLPASADGLIRVEDSSPTHPDHEDIAAMRAEAREAIAQGDERWYGLVVDSHLDAVKTGAAAWDTYGAPAVAGRLPRGRSYEALHRSIVGQPGEALRRDRGALPEMLVRTLSLQGIDALSLTTRTRAIVIVVLLRDIALDMWASADPAADRVAQDATVALFVLAGASAALAATP